MESVFSRLRGVFSGRRTSAVRLVPAAVAAIALLGLAGVCAHAQDPPPPPPPPPEAGGDAPATPTTPNTPATPAPAPPTGGAQPAGGRYLLLPDISFIGTMIGHTSDDNRDNTRDKFKLDEGEVGIQSFVYPNVKADVFITWDQGNTSSIEEAYLTVLNLGVPKAQMSAQVGRRKVPFDRVNQQHSHSWLYIVQPYALQNLVADESLEGDGGYVSYLLPIKSFYSQLDVGVWSVTDTPEAIDTNQDISQNLLQPYGAAFADRFTTARLWNAIDAFKGTFELGGSVARGSGNPYFNANAPIGNAGAVLLRPMTVLSAADVTYRLAGSGAARLLLRGEYINHHQDSPGQAFKRDADGYYLLADKRFNEYNSLAARYDESSYPFADGKERGVSLIATHSLTEQTYIRLQGIHGDRPGKKGFNEVWFQWVWGIGPHTHNLE